MIRLFCLFYLIGAIAAGVWALATITPPRLMLDPTPFVCKYTHHYTDPSVPRHIVCQP